LGAIEKYVVKQKPRSHMAAMPCIDIASHWAYVMDSVTQIHNDVLW